MSTAVDLVGSLDNVMLRNEMATLKMRVVTLETQLQRVMHAMQTRSVGHDIIGMRPHDMYNEYITKNGPVMSTSPPTSPQGQMYMDPTGLPLVPRVCYT